MPPPDLQKRERAARQGDALENSYQQQQRQHDSDSHRAAQGAQRNERRF